MEPWIWSISTIKDNWKSPIGGQLFPSPYRPHGHSGNGIRYQGPFEIAGEKGELAIEPIYKLHNIVHEKEGVQHTNLLETLYNGEICIVT